MTTSARLAFAAVVLVAIGAGIVVMLRGFETRGGSAGATEDAPGRAAVGARVDPVQLDPVDRVPPRQPQRVERGDPPASPTVAGAYEELTTIACRIELTGLVDAARDVVVTLSLGRERVTCERGAANVWSGRVPFTADDVERRLNLCAFVESPTYAWRSRVTALTGELADRDPVDWAIAMRRAGSLTLRVASASGRPANRGQVWLNFVGEDERAVEDACASRSLVLDERGTATIDGLQPGTWAMTVDDQHWWAGDGDEAHASAVVKPDWNEQVAWTVRELDSAEYLTARVIAPGVAAGCLEIEYVDEDGRVLETRAFEGGELYVGPLDADYEIRARARDRCTGRVSEAVTLRAGRHDHVLRIGP